MGTDQHQGNGPKESENEEVDKDGVGVGWKYLPSEALIQTLELLSYSDLGRCCQVCKRWNEIANLSYLWQRRFRVDFNINPEVGLRHTASSWKDEYQRLTDLVPSVEFERISEHEDEVLHVCFSNNGMMFCTCSKDTTVKVFSADWPFETIFSEDLGQSSQFRWIYTQFSQFSSSDTQLLVSGRCEGSHQLGEIIIYNIFADQFSLQARVRIKPYDVMGTWLNETHILSAKAHRVLARRQCLCEVLLNKSSQEIENLMHSTVTRSLMMACDNHNTVSYLKVADMKKVISQVYRSISLGCFHGKLHDMHIKAFAEHREASKQSERPENTPTRSSASEPQPPTTVSSIQVKVLKEAGESCSSNSINDDTLQEGKRPKLDCVTEVVDHKNLSETLSPAIKRRMAEGDNDTDSSNLFSGTTSPHVTDDELDQDSEFSEVTTGDETSINIDPPKIYKLLLCFTGSELDVPHKLGVKRITQEECTEVVRHEIDLERLQHRPWPSGIDGRPEIKTDEWDHVIEMGGQTVGMEISPCARYVYVNVRKWRSDPIPCDPRAPEISNRVTMVLIDLLSMEVLKNFGGHEARSDVFFLHISCNSLYVTSGSENRQGYLWDRHYGTRLSTFRHENVVNAVAVNPRDPGMAVSVSDDNVIKIWRSKSFHRLLSGARAKARIKPHSSP